MAGRGCVVFADGPEGLERYSPAHDVRKLLRDASNQHEFLAELPTVMRGAHALTAALGDGHFQFTVGLWNMVQQRAEAYVIGSPGHTLPSLPPFQLAGVSESVMPQIDRSLWPAGELCRREALAIVREQRRTPDAGGVFRVAGFAELTTVDATGVRTEIICRWPDRIGKKVDPRAWWTGTIRP